LIVVEPAARDGNEVERVVELAIAAAVEPMADVFPDDAGIGAVPVSRANPALERRFETSPTSPSNRAAITEPIPHCDVSDVPVAATARRMLALSSLISASRRRSSLTLRLMSSALTELSRRNIIRVDLFAFSERMLPSERW
jgi:hypothetical protein